MISLRNLLPLLLPSAVYAQADCDTAPTDAMRTVCHQLNNWDDSARSQPSAAPPRLGVAAPGIAGQASVMMELPAATITDPAACNDIPCICGIVGGTMIGSACRLASGAMYRKGVRKEYRMMTDSERNRFHAAMWTLKRNGDYDRLAHIHADVNQAPSAHSGPAFLAWHREFVKRFEIALRLVDPSLSLPYWDTTLEGALADVKYSCLWSTELMGDTMNGPVDTGAFRGWTNIDGNTIVRNLGQDSARVLNANDRNRALAKTRIDGILAYTSPRQDCPFPLQWDCMEFAHGYSHVYVGGEMLTQHTAAFDPIFFLYHSFIDSLWEIWRTQRQASTRSMISDLSFIQNRSTRETAYPVDNEACSSEAHFRNSIMSPFAPLQNIDGCSNVYTDNLYTYDRRSPSCSLGANCGSRFLFCDRSNGAPHCATKIRLDQPCNGYNQGEDMCYNSVCIDGICSVDPNDDPQATTQPPIRTVSTQAPLTESCFNEHECCEPWQARGECWMNPSYMRMWCQASCNICTPRGYDLTTECSDRHPSCRPWAAGGECMNNLLWMRENCRRSCNRCGRTRQQTCFPSNRRVTMAPISFRRRWNLRNQRKRLPFDRQPSITGAKPTVHSSRQSSRKVVNTKSAVKAHNEDNVYPERPPINRKTKGMNVERQRSRTIQRKTG